jgi:AraC-like DNA-binding protein
VTSTPAAAQLLTISRGCAGSGPGSTGVTPPLDVEALARGVHMSAGHLSREFRQAYGESPYAYLMTGASSVPWRCCAGAT